MAELRSCLQALLLMIIISVAAATPTSTTTTTTTTNPNTYTSISENVLEEDAGATRRGDPKVSGCSNGAIKLAKNASEEAIKLGIWYGSETESRMHKLKKSGKSTCKKCLAVCVRMYKEALDNLREALGYLRNKQYRMVKVEVVAAMNNAFDCEDEFETLKQKSPFTFRYRFFESLCNIPLGLSLVLDPSITTHD
ncbi:hypothetical protein Scep_028735 [Stephania cephalantha]|uniref:Pectinesterase inhibitor domain-containing protein n=1 Tax=Stephania cephalantha TaxID=152367 RepID=A0AAP0HIE2_9MAGN